MERLKATMIIVSDTAARDPSSDKSGEILREVFAKDGGDNWIIQSSIIVQDDVRLIQREIQRVTDLEDPVNLVVTTGGTGFATKDLTPEAVTPLVHRHAPGLVHAMLAASLQITPFAAMSRPIAGVRHKTLILTLPGSPKGAKENLQAIIKLLPHACLQAAGEDSRKLHVGGVKRLEEKAGVGVRYEQSEAHGHHDHSHSHSHSHNHSHGHGSHVIPRAHTQPGNRPISNDPQAGPTQRHRHSPYPMISVEKATGIILENTPRTKVTVAQANSELLGHILAKDVVAIEDVPAFEASIVDGYATSTFSKGTYKVASISHAAPGEPPALQHDEIARITTGAPLPHGAKGVVMVEDTVIREITPDGKEEALVEVLTDEVQPGENIRAIGSDVRKGETVLRENDEITAIGGEIGLLSSVGVSEVTVFEKPVVGVLSTGDELVEHNQPGPLRTGQVRDTNRPALLTAIRAWGYEGVDLGIAQDKPSTLESTLRLAFRRCQTIVTTGGVSMGELDLLKPTIERSLGGTIHFGRLSMKPGKPTTFATVPFKSTAGDRGGDDSDRTIFSLPGNPASAMVTLHLLVLPSLQKAKGVREARAGLPRCVVEMDEDVRCDPQREEYCRARVSAGLDGKLHAITTGGQRSSRVGSLTTANALLVLPVRRGVVGKGERVQALMMGQAVGL